MKFSKVSTTSAEWSAEAARFGETAALSPRRQGEGLGGEAWRGARCCCLAAGASGMLHALCVAESGPMATSVADEELASQRDRGGGDVATNSAVVTPAESPLHDVYIVDEDEAAQLAQLVGEIPGCRLHVFASPVDALAALRATESPPALILSQEAMRQMDGISFLAAARREYPDVVRVLVTDGVEKAAIVRAVNEAGIYQYVEKPYDREALRLIVHNAYERGDLVATLRRTVRALRSNNEALSTVLRQIQRAQERLLESERMAAVGRVASGIAHEIGNQLSVLTYAELIRDRYPDDGEIRLFTAAILSARTRLGGLVGEIRDFSRVHGQQKADGAAGRPVASGVSAGDTAPRYALIEEGVHLSVLEALSILRFDPAFRLRHVERALEPANGRPPTAMVNRDKLVQVIVNLLRNAVDATPSGGEIHIALEADPLPWELGLPPLDGPAEALKAPQVRIVIDDFGDGISPDVLPRIFEPFFSTKGDRGTGLGLGICRSIMAQHGGELLIQSPVPGTSGAAGTSAAASPVAGAGSALGGTQRGAGTRAVVLLPRRG